MNISFESRSGSAGRPNEDWAAATPHSVVVLDGVTAPRLLPETGCLHNVPWYTHHLGTRMIALMDESLDLPAVLAAAIESVADLHRDTCNLVSPAIPSAVVAMLRHRGDVVDYLVLADAVIALDTCNGIQIISDTRVEQAAPEATARTREDPIGSPEHQQAVAIMSVEQLKRRNVEGGYWVAGADTEAAAQAIVGQIPAAELRRAAILSDGASRVVDTFHEMNWSDCLDYLDEQGPHGLINHVRQIENSDPEGLMWPRFKTSDDATAALIRMC
ncbi:integrase [Streptosporangium sp. NPDC051023]|uniref:integrase n=1 Tax=Streptosporangium sp. NPDC051023 TaxID=3155410 RepID=UPI00344CBD7D